MTTKPSQHPVSAHDGSSMDDLLQTMTRAVNTLARAGIRFAVAGGCAVYARGGPPSGHDVDIFLRKQDAAPALRALREIGMKPVNPPEDWLTKVYDGDVLVDLIFSASGREITDEFLDRATSMRVGSAVAPVVGATDLMIDKLNVLDAHRCDFVPMLAIARDLREQVDWPEVVDKTRTSPYARAFLGLLDDLEIASTK
ncbi:nucleotidyltransferase family protein [Rhodococcus sp. KBS0724]|uniref:nucleotidyltransferase n=1 Tax=Rhodococcus sp. KBS0724 TaxID=1179674 RepID=UPI00110F66AF|nr:nucleotidyltransferase [Rhodococcus sp. KBS0724]TSD49939.1 nucleotidyltransferase family protein [Rhodococcus sp. KBS0724]